MAELEMGSVAEAEKWMMIEAYADRLYGGLMQAQDEAARKTACERIKRLCSDARHKAGHPCHSISRGPRSERASRRVHIAPRAVIVGLRAIRVGRSVRRNIRAPVGRIAGGRVAVRVRAGSVLSLCGSSRQRQSAS